MQAEVSTDGPNQRSDSRHFAGRVWIATLVVASVFAGVLLLWIAAKVFLLFFAASLFAIFLRAVADLVGRITRLSRDWALAIALLVLLGACGGLGWLLATPITKQVEQVSDELPQVVQRLQSQLSQSSWGRALTDKIDNPSGLVAQTGGVLKKAQTLFSISLKGVVDLLVILFCGFYLAARPEIYVDGVLRLMPRSKRARGRVVLEQIGQGLRHWLIGQIISMSIIGFLTWLGLLLLGVPASEVLGILAGILDFVPVAGPWVAGIVSCALALLRSPMRAVFVACLFIVLHLLEGHVLIPLIQNKAARLPPVLTILAMVLFYTLFGFFGLLLAVPLLAVILVTVRSLYVEDVIEQPPAPVQNPIAVARK